MPNNYVGNTGDTNGNHLEVQYRAAIDDHVAQLSVKGFSRTSRTDINKIAIHVNFDPNIFFLKSL